MAAKSKVFFGFLAAISIGLTVYQNCSPTSFSTAGGTAGQKDAQNCQKFVEPQKCPLDPPYAYPEAKCTDCSDTNISRYKGLILTYRARGTSLCVPPVDVFPNDTTCPAGGSADPRICTPGPVDGVTTARDCVNAAASSPVITVGIGGGSFGYDRLIVSQAVTLIYRGQFESICPSSDLVSILYNNTDGYNAARNALINNYDKGTNHNFFPTVFIGYAMGLITAGVAGSADSTTVSLNMMNTYIATMQTKVQSMGCDNFKAAVLAVH